MADRGNTLDRAERAHAATVQRLGPLEQALVRRAETMATERQDKTRRYGRWKSTWTGAGERTYAACLDDLCRRRRKELAGLRAKIDRQAEALAGLKRKAAAVAASTRRRGERWPS